jgi:hypothetical protein
MNTVMGEALTKALDNKKSDYSQFKWKGPKIKVGEHYEQESIRLIDASPAQLITWYKHCEKMLNNDDPKNPGRYNVFELVKDQINKCNVELLVRYFQNVYLSGVRPGMRRHDIAPMILALKHQNPEIEDWSKIKMSMISAMESYIPGGIPDEFANVSVNDLMLGCTDSLGALDKSHLTMSFIVKMGLWITKSEENELKGKDNTNVERLRVAKERLRLPEKLVLRFSDKGLSFHEMRAILTLPKKQRYSDMTTEQLITLRNKVLVRYLKEVDNHIYSWKKLMKEIELVAKSKGVKLQ